MVYGIFTVRFEKLHFWKRRWTIIKPRSVQWQFLPKCFSATFWQKKLKFLIFLGTDSTFHHCPQFFLTLTPFFFKRIRKIDLFIDWLYWQRFSWPLLIFSVNVNFQRSSFCRKKLKTQHFWECNCYLYTNFCPINPCMVYH